MSNICIFLFGILHIHFTYIKAAVRVNFGPQFILKCNDVIATAVAELQPMDSADRKVQKDIEIGCRFLICSL